MRKVHKPWMVLLPIPVHRKEAAAAPDGGTAAARAATATATPKRGAAAAATFAAEVVAILILALIDSFPDLMKIATGQLSARLRVARRHTVADTTHPGL